MTLAQEPENLESRQLCYAAAAMAEMQLQAIHADVWMVQTQIHGHVLYIISIHTEDIADNTILDHPLTFLIIIFISLAKPDLRT